MPIVDHRGGSEGANLIGQQGERRLEEAQASTIEVMARILEPLAEGERLALHALLARFIDSAARQE